MLDWVIVGGGIHGVHMAVRLVGEARVDPERIRIVDPGSELLHSWHRCSSNTGMTHLRSPGVHHLDLDPWSLMRFGDVRGRHGKGARGLFAPPYNRPAVRLFTVHCEHVVSRYGLSDLHVRDHAAEIDLSCDGARVTLASGAALCAERVLLAVGASDQPRWPQWARSLVEGGASVRHVFDPGFVLRPETLPGRVAVVGGGITGAQVAMRLEDGAREVHLISRHQLRRHPFDSDPGWVGPKNMRRFAATPDPEDRRRMIRAARHRGSLPADVHRALRAAFGRGRIWWHRGEVVRAWTEGSTRLWLGSEQVEVDAVLLATGFESRRPGGKLVDQLVETHSLPCATCGFPVVDTHLRWHPRVFVTGPLAELEIGPVSRNIIGARRAAERIVPMVGTPRQHSRQEALHDR